jgi:hypothetical protein
MIPMRWIPSLIASGLMAIVTLVLMWDLARKKRRDRRP